MTLLQEREFRDDLAGGAGVVRSSTNIDSESNWSRWRDWMDRHHTAAYIIGGLGLIAVGACAIASESFAPGSGSAVIEFAKAAAPPIAVAVGITYVGLGSLLACAPRSWFGRS